MRILIPVLSLALLSGCASTLQKPIGEICKQEAKIREAALATLTFLDVNCPLAPKMDAIINDEVTGGPE